MDYILLFISFCSGIFGAAVGSLTAFIFTGLTGLIGIAFLVAGVPFDFMGLVPFGVFFGPHISFAGGAAAAAYARKRGYLPSGKDIVKPLISLRKPDVLIVGGIMGGLGYIVNFGINQFMPGKIDAVAITVVIIAIISKVIFGDLGIKEIIGVVPDSTKKLGGRYSPNSPGVWIEFVNSGAEKLMLAVGVGGISAYATYAMLQNEATAPAAVFIGFVISATSLLFAEFGLPIPATHHISIGAAYAVLMSGSLVWGFAGAIFGAYLADFLGKTFHVYGDAHVDPPSLSIALNSFILLGILPLTKVYEMGNVVPFVIIGVLVLLALLEKNIFSAKGNELT